MTTSARPLRRSADSRRVVLLVDDDNEFRHMLRRQLERRSGIAVLETSSALGARTHLEQTFVDLIVADLNMPGGRGDELLTEVGERWPGVRRLLLSGFTTPDMVAEAPYEVLEKTLRPWLIVDAVVRLARSA